MRSVRARGVDLRLAKPVETASGAMASTPLVLIDVLTNGGITGCSYVRCYTSVALRPLVDLITNVAALIAGGDASPAAGLPLAVFSRPSGRCAPLPAASI